MENIIQQTSSASQELGRALNRYVRPFFLVFSVFFVTVAMLSDAFYDPGDGIMHYQIARYSWAHPDLLLNHWGKPAFTLIASVPAQFGYKGIVLFNVLLHIGTAWLTWRIADRMKLPFAFLAGPLVMFMPVSYGVAQSGLTEPVFAFTLLLGIYFMTGGRYKTSALIISLLPFVRTEGILLAPLFALFLIARKEYYPMVLLSAGFLVYSALGGLFVHHDFLWFLHQNPYVGEPDYGSGSLFHFVSNNEFLFGTVVSLLVIPGLVTGLFRKKFAPVHSLTEIVLINGCFVVFFAAHSVFWWQGAVGSFGMLRVMACIAPCAVIIALRGLEICAAVFRNNRTGVALLLILTTGLTAYNSIRQHRIVLTPDQRQVVAREVANDVIAAGLKERTVYCGDPIMTVLLDKDPFNTSQWKNISDLLTWGPEPGSVILWDSGFARTQYNVAKEDLGKLHNRQLTKVLEHASPVDGETDPWWIVYAVGPDVIQ